ncbi:MAG: solute carrier family 23 protein, partial [Paracoccus sp. (in: a-proteobacteria)]|nr:solute carrier family 23 protein [Paracoccus sp. (in: a-proteobacteria)]
MTLYTRKDGEEHPYWPAGPFKVRLPLIHYRIEFPEAIQAMIMFVVALGMIPLLQQYLGMPYEAALAGCVICGIGFMMPALLGVPLVPGWITPAIPVVLLYLSAFQPGPEAVAAMIALQLIVCAIFVIFGVTGLGEKIVNGIPNSLKSGIIIGAGLAALMGELAEGGRIPTTPISILAGTLIALYIMFSLSFKDLMARYPLAKKIGDFGMVPAILVAMVIGWSVGEYPLPDIEWGITQPDFGALAQYSLLSVSLPSIDVFLLALPTALIAYVIAFGDIIVGNTLTERVDDIRTDERVDDSVTRIHLVTAIRNGMHAILAPWPGLAGPLWTPVHATVAERYGRDKTAMQTIFSGAGTFWIFGFLALFILPLVTAFRPVLPIALSLTLVLTGYICIMVGIEQLTSSTERGVAGIVAVVLAMPDPKATVYAVGIGVLLYFLLERRPNPDPEVTSADEA